MLVSSTSQTSACLSLIIVNPNGFIGQCPSAGKASDAWSLRRKEDENELVSTRTEQPRAPRVVLGRFPPRVAMMKSTHSWQRDDFRRG